MARPQRKTRASAPIPENLPPVFAPKNGRITRATVEAVKRERKAEEWRRVLRAALKALAQVKTEELAKRVEQIPSVPRVQLTDGSYRDTPLIIRQPMGATQCYAQISGATSMLGTSATGGLLYDRGTGAGLIQTPATTYNNDGTILTWQDPLGHQIQETLMQAYTQRLQHQHAAMATQAITNHLATNTAITTTHAYTFTAATGNAPNAITIHFPMTLGADTVTGDGILWTGALNDWAQPHDNCNLDNAWLPRHREHDWEVATDLIQELTQQQRAWRQWNTVLHTAKESRAQQEARTLRDRQDQEARERAERVRLQMYAQRQGRAERLLKAVLNAEQRADYEANKYFIVRSQSGKRYLIDGAGQHGNVYLLDERGTREVSYCIQPIGGLPDADAHIAQKLMLETNEAAFLATANATRQYRAA